ncbi:CvpA family protein [Sphaerobacter sp.]|uniref:CvpA family protein n=1 Tax=Sphaerobacter sp. TaxID=2099654 RepID=UPI001DA5B1AA|nr:CvpA family protein [Sphaerobacter sp.]MBX5444792.1 CvpA family protein [Sphaerobacter sp.]
MNVVDIVMTFVFLGVFTLGFFAGPARAVIGLVALYGGLVAASVFYQPLGRTLTDLFWPMSPWIGAVTAFILLVAVVGGALLYVLLWSFRVSRLRSRFASNDHGGRLGMVVVVLVSVVISATVVTTAIQLADWSVQNLPEGDRRAAVTRHLNGSVIAGSTRRLTPHLYTAVVSWTPVADAPILRPD